MRASIAVAALLFVTTGAWAQSTSSVAISETQANAVQPRAAAMVTRQVYATVARLGLRAVSESETARASRFSPGGPTAADLLALAQACHAEHALGAALGSHGENYVVTLVLANADRTGPFTLQSETTADGLEGAVDAMTRALLPPRVPEPGGGAPSSAERVETIETGAFRLAVQTEGAASVTSRGFYNHLAGARLDYAFPGRFAFGAYAGYVNAKGKEGRVHDVLAYLQLEYRAPLFGSSRLQVPLRFGSGYLPKNGPVLRFAAGLTHPLGDRARITFDLIAPTVWIVRDSAVLSMDVAAEVSFNL
jgi:hypothetical protein